MLRFDSDYMECCTPEILKKLSEINYDPQTGYGLDEVCDSAKDKIKKACGLDDAEIYFLAGGTMTNAVTLNAMLKPYEGIISADTGHIATHESGAVEHSGHKVLTLKNTDGKISAEQIREYVNDFYAEETYPHMVFPGAVYISHPTEFGTLYSRKELEDISSVCRENNIKLYLDGARMGYGLVSEGTDVTLNTIAKCCDAFYIGGTKVGTLFGEALVFPKHIVDNFFTIIKQNGALLAKGFVCGAEFDTLFTDDLYFKISENAIKAAMHLKEGLINKGYKMLIDSKTNQQFVIIKASQLDNLREHASFNLWGKVDEDHVAIRLVTSWATTIEKTDALLALF